MTVGHDPKVHRPYNVHTAVTLVVLSTIHRGKHTIRATTKTTRRLENHKKAGTKPQEGWHAVFGG
jgi:hypothetical protein